MAEWWRSWHGAPTDPKWRVVAKRAKVPTCAVVAVAWAVFDRASQAEDRGSAVGFDAEVIADFLDLDPDDVERIIEAMKSKTILDGDRVASWDKRQPKREREEDNSAERTRKYRERLKNSSGSDGDVDATERHVTPCDATERHVTPRGEEKREEKKEERSAAADPTTRVREAAAAQVSEDFHDRVLEAAGIDVSKDTSGKWFSTDQRWRSSRWLELLTEDEVLAEIRAKAATMRQPPGTLAYFDKLIAAAAGRKSEPKIVPLSPSGRASPSGQDRDAALDAYFARLERELSTPGA